MFSSAHDPDCHFCHSIQSVLIEGFCQRAHTSLIAQRCQRWPTIMPKVPVHMRSSTAHQQWCTAMQTKKTVTVYLQSRSYRHLALQSSAQGYTELVITRKSREVEPMLVWCWSSDADGRPALNQHQFNVASLQGKQKRDVAPTMALRWTIVCNAGPMSTWHWMDVSCSPGYGRALFRECTSNLTEIIDVLCERAHGSKMYKSSSETIKKVTIIISGALRARWLRNFHLIRSWSCNIPLRMR